MVLSGHVRWKLDDAFEFSTSLDNTAADRCVTHQHKIGIRDGRDHVLFRCSVRKEVQIMPGVDQNLVDMRGLEFQVRPFDLQPRDPR